MILKWTNLQNECFSYFKHICILVLLYFDLRESWSLGLLPGTECCCTEVKDRSTSWQHVRLVFIHKQYSCASLPVTDKQRQSKCMTLIFKACYPFAFYNDINIYISVCLICHQC